MYVFSSYWLRQPEMFCLKLLFSVQENNQAFLTFKVTFDPLPSILQFFIAQLYFCRD